MDTGIDIKIENYLKLIRKNYTGVERAFLFGSYAKGKSSEESDIDLALVFNELKDSERFDIQVQLMLLASKIDSRIEPHPISTSDFECALVVRDSINIRVSAVIPGNGAL